MCAGANPRVPQRTTPHIRRSVVQDEECYLYSYSHEVAVVIAAYGASIARLAGADSLHCNVRERNQDFFPMIPVYRTSQWPTP